LSIEEEIEPPIVARGVNATAVPVYSTSKNSHHTIAEKDLATHWLQPTTKTRLW